VHPSEGNVYDFTLWAAKHNGNLAAAARGNPSPIQKHADRGSAVLPFPPNHPVSRFVTALTSASNEINLLGRLGDTVDFVELPTSVQFDSMAALLGADGDTGADFGTESCGSPGEIANDPYAGNRFWFGFGADKNLNEQVTDTNARSISASVYPRHLAWEHVAFNATDQLRQRVAWALSQIFVVNDVALGDRASELALVYYDIFVRNAFTNYRDVMKEVSYSYAMASMLSFKNSKSFQFSGYYPDENYAREIMQLFTMGLWHLHDNGTKVTDSDGRHIPTYAQEDVVNFARAWTGLYEPLPRANYESPSNDKSISNRIDPMRLVMTYRDPLPKTDLTGGYIGDGHPLCEDLPERAFLRRGARYEYLGTSAAPRKSHLSHRTYSDADNRYAVKLELHRDNSELYGVLCSPDAANGSSCRFRSEVQLPHTVPCDGKECRVDTAVVVKLRGAGTRNNGEPFDVYYEYVRQPCVDLSYFDAPVLITPRFFRGYGGVKPTCANPRSAVAGAGCCRNTTARQKGTCVHEYSDELVTLATAEARCEAYGSAFEPCAKDGDARCLCPRNGEVRFGFQDPYTASWSVPVVIGSTGHINCTNASFGNFSVPDGVSAMCQCRRPTVAGESYGLCDGSNPSGQIDDSNAANGCEVRYRHFWTGSQPCQMQAQVGHSGLITMVDHVEGPTAAFPGTANMSTELSANYKASKGNDGRMYTSIHTTRLGSPNPWWQLNLEAPRAVGSITVHNRYDACAARLFENNTGCQWEYGVDTATSYGGFKVGVSNTSCSDSGEGCSGVVCGHVQVPTLRGEGHAYAVSCDPPVVGTHAYIVLPGERRLLSVVEIEVRGANPPRGRFNDVEFKPEARMA
jgi:hypothetical protein